MSNVTMYVIMDQLAKWDGGGVGGQCGDIDFVYHGPQIIYPYLFLFLKLFHP